MELWKASMTLTTAGFFAPNGSGAIANSDPRRRTSSSFTIRTTGIVASRGKHPCRSSKKMASDRSFHLPDTNYRKSARKFRREPFPSFVSSAAIESWISLGSIFPFRRPLFILMSGQKSLRACIRFSSIAATNWSLPSLTNYHHGWIQTLKTPITEKGRMRCFFINGISGQGSYPQPLHSPAPDSVASGLWITFGQAPNC